MKRLMIGLIVLVLSLATGFVYGEGVDEHVVLLLHNNGEDGSTNFIDASVVGAHTVTANGDVHIDASEYKFGGGSAFFDGEADYLSIPDSDNWDFGAGDFTIDFWVRFNDIESYQYFYQQYGGAKNTIYFIKHGSQRLNFYVINGGTIKADYIMTDAWSGLRADTWYHIALVREGTSLNMYINGLPQALTETTPISTGDLGNYSSVLYIGSRYNSTNAFNGWIDQYRVSKGIARWSSEFNPPKEEYYASIFFVSAGVNQIVKEEEPVTLNGSHSYILGTNIAYHWTQISGPPVALSDDSVVNPTFSAPEVDVKTDLKFSLVGTDIDTGEQSNPDYVTVTVLTTVKPEEDQLIEKEQVGVVDSFDAPVRNRDIWYYLTDKDGQAKLGVRIILLIALAIFLFFYAKRRLGNP